MGRKSKADLPETMELLERVAKLYYVSGLNQQEIAEQLNIGRSSVARFLKDARNAGIVTIYVGTQNSEDRSYLMEKSLVHTFSMKDAVVVNGSAYGKFGLIGAQYLNTVMPHSGYIGVGGGNTIYQIGQFLDVCEKRENLTIVQVNGQSLKVPEATVVHRWASRLGSMARYLPVPILLDDPDTRLRLMDDPAIHATFSCMNKLSMIFVGIGATSPICTTTPTDVGAVGLEEALPQNCVGDIVLHFFDRKGEFCYPALSERVMSISTEQFAEIPTRVGVAYGKEKIESIYAALTGKLINVLITDEATAGALLELHSFRG